MRTKWNFYLINLSFKLKRIALQNEKLCIYYFQSSDLIIMIYTGLELKNCLVKEVVIYILYAQLKKNVISFDSPV